MFNYLSQLKTNVYHDSSNDKTILDILVPGVSKEQINVEVRGRLLKISVVNNKSNDSSEFKEFSSIYEAERQFAFKEFIDSDNTQVSLKDGILNIQVGYSAPINQRKLTIN